MYTSSFKLIESPQFSHLVMFSLLVPIFAIARRIMATAHRRTLMRRRTIQIVTNVLASKENSTYKLSVKIFQVSFRRVEWSNKKIK